MPDRPELTKDEIVTEAQRLHAEECFPDCPRIPRDEFSSWYEYGEISLRLKWEQDHARQT